MLRGAGHATQVQGDDDFPPGFDPLTDYWWDGSDPATMWQDAAKTVPVTAASDPVRVWRSKGVAIDAVAQFDPERATWDGGSNLTFSGTQYYVIAANVVNVNQEKTIVTVFTPAGSNFTYPVATRFTRGYQVGYTVGTLQYAVIGGPNVDLAMSSSRIVGIVATSANNASVTVRGNSLETTAGASAGIIDEPPTLIGRTADTSTANGTKIASVYIKPNYAANATERAALETWFAAKYGVVLPE